MAHLASEQGFSEGILQHLINLLILLDCALKKVFSVGLWQGSCRSSWYRIWSIKGAGVHSRAVSYQPLVRIEL